MKAGRALAGRRPGRWLSRVSVDRAGPFLFAVLIMPVLLQSTQSDSLGTVSKEKAAPSIVLEARNLLGAVGPVTVEVIPGSERVL